MKKIDFFNTLVIDSDNNCIHLCHSDDISDVVYSNTTDQLVMIDDYGYADGNLPDTLYKEDFDNLYYPDENGEYEFVHVEDSLDDEPVKHRYSKADFCDDYFEHYKVLHTEHGINQGYYDITNAEIIPCDIFMADDDVPQEYPRQEHERYFKAISDEDGKVYYVKATSPFFCDDCDDVYKFTDEETFNSYD